jgi:hypothetical protein
VMVRRAAAGKLEMGSAAESTSASSSSRVSAPLAEAWGGASSSGAESESSEWSGLDGEGSWERFRLRHLSFASGMGWN